MPPDERRALLRRRTAAITVLRTNPGMTEGDKLSLLANVVWPSEPIRALHLQEGAA